MKTYIIEMPDGWKDIKPCNFCPNNHRLEVIYGYACNVLEVENCPIANAREAVIVDETHDISRWVNHHLKDGAWVSRTEVNGSPVTLYAVKKEGK